MQHYADLFDDEQPGTNNRFGYEFDHAPRTGRRVQMDMGDDPDAPRATKKRRGWFGRR
jgi:hypothetical protein